MRRPRRFRGKAGSHDNLDRWLITYADLITLLLIFFVVMYAMSKVDVAKFMTLSQSLAMALHDAQTTPATTVNGTLGPSKPALPESNQTSMANLTQPSQGTPKPAETEEDKQLDELYQQIKVYIQEHHLEGNVTVVDEPRGVQITFRDIVLFDTGKADIKPQAQQLLAGLVPFFQKLPNSIVIEGYTDNQPIHTAQFPSNWELSAARAIGVVHFLADHGVAPDRLSGVGYGEYHPVVPNDTPEHRQQNRRVNIVILRQPNSSTAPSS
ncbi:MAG: OmpA family protein [Thermoflavifilum sp.]|nr:OmpA family protein [Thermoflavifilum sp.]MCL6514154.1 OmpA family protein [Alicyclobacillus sp.]